MNECTFPQWQLRRNHTAELVVELGARFDVSERMSERNEIKHVPREISSNRITRLAEEAAKRSNAKQAKGETAFAAESAAKQGRAVQRSR